MTPLGGRRPILPNIGGDTTGLLWSDGVSRSLDAVSRAIAAISVGHGSTSRSVNLIDQVAASLSLSWPTQLKEHLTLKPIADYKPRTI
jgi:hypothetical protein